MILITIDLISSTTSSVSKHSTPSDQSIYSSNTLADFISSSGYELITGHTTYIAESISHTTESIYSSNRPLVPLASSSGYELITGHTTYTIESISHTTESIYSSNRPLVPLALSSGYEQTTNTATQSSTAHQDSVTSTTITNSNLATETAEMPSTQTCEYNNTYRHLMYEHIHVTCSVDIDHHSTEHSGSRCYNHLNSGHPSLKSNKTLHICKVCIIISVSR